MPPLRAILHLDMDAFFAAIAQRDDPSLRGRPVLTGGGGPRGVVTTASYEARVFGCRSAMPTAVALRLCPQAVCVKVSGDAIRVASRKVREVMERVTPLVQPLSVDEAFLDVTGSAKLFGSPRDVALKLKREVFAETGLVASVGVSHNKFLAKLASDLEKPDGLTVIGPGDVDRILPPLPIGRVPGVGPALVEKLQRRGVCTIADLRAAGAAGTTGGLGLSPAQAAHLLDLAHGRDERPVSTGGRRKSVGQERTFGINLPDPQRARVVLATQCDEVARRLRARGLLARGVSVKLRTGDFKTVTRSAVVSPPSDATADLRRVAGALFDAWAHRHFRPLRLLGVTAGPLQEAADGEQLGLFDAAVRGRNARVDAAVDAIRARFGDAAAGRADATL
ncbi:DNA polymerase IV [Phycisphaera mikurensis]|uniref:DNA polymerase IV n=1 Tax=Phycisphaera mikurensis (strain NBRC 102666 / KCTC 22515 / FYK2301M01) TaxID=1142394 RepID=I0IFC8_PHYMF|nr:DNA polymerase IV [Phycisphaera mikurensis]MBB6440641.1 DNA polymerase-4 [Phycisphaera mikurensis]BAM03966.1 DNA polymerase IV [Phycisphaera mikurensis NBRC 102666]